MASVAVEEAQARAAAAEEAKIELSLRLAELADARDNVSEFMVNGYHHQPVSQGLIEQLQRRCEEAELAAAVNARRAAAAEASVEALRTGGLNGSHKGYRNGVRRINKHPYHSSLYRSVAAPLASQASGGVVTIGGAGAPSGVPDFLSGLLACAANPRANS